MQSTSLMCTLLRTPGIYGQFLLTCTIILSAVLAASSQVTTPAGPQHIYPSSSGSETSQRTTVGAIFCIYLYNCERCIEAGFIFPCFLNFLVIPDMYHVFTSI